ncbi:doublecortin domain-containing protein 2-like [Garra rufa]|uniref:doublecortin domain-containing protein 2-like n=1 Tax=Garra rufa TaxID=137080 RepID=UPI003CCEA692
MSAEKPNFLSQPEVKNIFFYRNGDPYYEPRRLVINSKRVSTFDTLLREVTGGVRAPFGAVRNIYTPKAGHRVDSLEHLRSGEQYVAAGREKFKKIDYSQITTRKKKALQPNGLLKPVPQSRVIVSARFLKPIKEPCAIFVVANGDVLNPAVRLLIPSRVIGQFERILEMITEKMGLRIVGGVRSLYTFEGTLVMDGKELENGQFYVAVGRDKFKKLPYSDLLFNKPIGMKRVNGSKAASLPPIYKYRRQNGEVGNHHLSKSECEEKSSPPAQTSTEQLSSIVREISQAKLMNIRKKRSELTASQETHDNDDGEDRRAEDDKCSPVQQEAEEVGPDVEESTTTESEAVPNSEESPCDEEEEKKPEAETEEEKKEEDEEIKEEEPTSEPNDEANDDGGEKKDEEAEGGDEEEKPEEGGDEEEKPEEGAEEETQENTENEGKPTEDNPEPSEDVSANTE